MARTAAGRLQCCFGGTRTSKLVLTWWNLHNHTNSSPRHASITRRRDNGHLECVIAVHLSLARRLWSELHVCGARSERLPISTSHIAYSRSYVSPVGQVGSSTSSIGACRGVDDKTSVDFNLDPFHFITLHYSSWSRQQLRALRRSVSLRYTKRQSAPSALPKTAIASTLSHQQPSREVGEDRVLPKDCMCANTFDRTHSQRPIISRRSYPTSYAQ